MNGVSWWLMLLSFVLGALITWFWMIRRVTREVPVSREVRAGGSLAAGAGLGAGAAAVGAGALALDGDADADADVDVPSVAADLDADLPSVDGGLDVDVPLVDADLPSVDGGLDVDVPLVDADLDVPSVVGDLDADLPSVDADLDVPSVGGDLDVDVRSLDGDLDADLPSVDADLGSAGVGLGVGLGAAALGSPAADFELPSLDADLDVPSVVGDLDADVPSLDGDLDVPAVDADLDAEGEQLTLGGDLDVDVPAVSGDAAGVGLLGAAAGAVSVAGSGKFGKGSATPAADGSGPAGWLVKGNEDSGLYHSPESPWYGRTKAEVWFETDEEAEKAGFISWRTRLRKAGAAKAAGDAAAASALVSAEANGDVSVEHVASSNADASVSGAAAFASVAGSGKFGKGSATPAADGSGPAGWLVKGNEDSGLYHSPESPWYGRTKAEVWFETDEEAEKAGFISWRTRVRKAGAAKAAAPAARTVKATSAKAAPKGRATKASRTAKPVKSAVAFVAVPEGKFGKGSADPNPDGSGPAGWTIKGNEDSNLYHSPESPWYGRTIAEVWFETEEAAEGAGFVSWRTRTRKAGADKAGAAAFVAVPEGKVGKGSADPNPDGSGPAGWTIKGNEDSNLYHSPESPWYGRTIAEVWFETEEAAEGAGFVSWRTRTPKAGADKAGAPAFVAVPEGKFGKGSADPNPDGSGPAGWTIKGNEDSNLYHSPESPWYGRTIAEVWFETEEAAEGAGFVSWRTRTKK